MHARIQGRRIGLVLGGGGTAGLAFHAGTLLALEQDLGWDPRTADVIVGTSAGSIVAGLLRGGVGTDDLAAWGAEVPPRPGRARIRRVLDRVDEVGWRVRPVLSRPRLPTPAWWWRAVGPSGVAPHAALAALLPAGPVDGATAVRRTAPLLPDRADDGLLVTAVRVRDGRRVVFGRDAAAALDDAVAASCAIPGLFRPVSIDGVRYVDGGAHSPTNADVLAGTGVEVAVVLSPMTAVPGAAGRRADAPMRRFAARRLRHELAALARAGIDAVVFEPSAATLAAMGWNPLARANVASIISSSFLSTATGVARERLAA